MDASQWEDDLIWCPSQCYLDVEWPDKTPAILYLRWRHEDPWSGYVITGFHHRDWHWPNEGKWSGDVLRGEHPADEIEAAKAELIAVFNYMYADAAGP